MEFAAAALTSIGSSLSAGVGAIGSAFSGATGAIGGMSTVASILSGGATVLGVLNMQRAAEQKETALKLQADDADTTAEIEAIQGTDRRNSLKAALTQAIGERDVAAAASGVDLSFGTPAVARRQAQVAGERALAIDQNTEDLRVSRLQERAANLRASAAGARAGGLGSAAALALQGGAALLRRG